MKTVAIALVSFVLALAASPAAAQETYQQMAVRESAIARQNLQKEQRRADGYGILLQELNRLAYGTADLEVRQPIAAAKLLVDRVEFLDGTLWYNGWYFTGKNEVQALDDRAHQFSEREGLMRVVMTQLTAKLREEAGAPDVENMMAAVATLAKDVHAIAKQLQAYRQEHLDRVARIQRELQGYGTITGASAATGTGTASGLAMQGGLLGVGIGGSR